MDKKKFKLLEWAKKHAPKALDFVGDVTGVSLLNNLSDVIENKNPDNNSPEALAEARKIKELDLKELDSIINDRSNARNREIEMAKTGKQDWLMYVTGIVALGAFSLMVYAVIFIDEIQENTMFHQLMGIIEGVVLTIFAYYFGTSKSSNDKTRYLTGK